MAKVTIAVLLCCLTFIGEAYGATASWYSTEACKYNRHPDCPTASGLSLYSLEEEGRLWAARPTPELGFRYRVCNDDNGRCVDVDVLDVGPHRRLNREIDLCKKAFSQIAELDKGLIEVTIRRIG